MGFHGEGIRVGFIVPQSDESNEGFLSFVMWNLLSHNFEWKDLIHHDTSLSLVESTHYNEWTEYGTAAIAAVSAKENNGFCSIGIAYKCILLFSQMFLFLIIFT
jgi:hypothetical protein